MRVSGIRVAESGDACELRGWVESDANPDDTDWFAPFPLWWRFPTWCAPLLSERNGDPFLAALRSAAQMVSYEVSIGFVIITVLLLVGVPAVLLDTTDHHLEQEIREHLAADRSLRITDLHVWRVGPEAHAAIVSVASDGLVTGEEIRRRLAPVHELAHLTIECR